MVSSTTVQAKVNYGFSKAAAALGDPYVWYRPAATGTNPIVVMNVLGQVNAQFTPDKNLTFVSPALFKSAENWYGFTDNMGDLLPGDYLVGTLGTFFITYIERFVPLNCVWCNRTLNIGRATDPLPPGGSTDYSGESVQNLTPILTSWPVSLRLPGMRTRDPKMKLPTDAHESVYQALLPASVAVALDWNDVVTDDLGQRYSIDAIEESPMGTRLILDMWPPG